MSGWCNRIFTQRRLDLQKASINHQAYILSFYLSENQYIYKVIIYTIYQGHAGKVCRLQDSRMIDKVFPTLKLISSVLIAAAKSVFLSQTVLMI